MENANTLAENTSTKEITISCPMTASGWVDKYSYSSSIYKIGTSATLIGNLDGINTVPGNTCMPIRMYVSFNMPSLPKNSRIKKAELKIFQGLSALNENASNKIGVYHIIDEDFTDGYYPVHDSRFIDYAEINQDESNVCYTFDVTGFIDSLVKGENTHPKLGIMTLNEGFTGESYITVHGNLNDQYTPQLTVTYETNYAVNTAYRTNTHELGRFGEGSIDLLCGNLMFESEDFSFGGTRMPVTIKHLYNSALSDKQYTNNPDIKLYTGDFSGMKVGNGFRLNIMQGMSYVSNLFPKAEGENKHGYVYTDENGAETYFKVSEKTATDPDNQSFVYNLYEDVDSGETIYEPRTRTLTIGTQKYIFDYLGNPREIQDEYGNSMFIGYDSQEEAIITSVTDGAGRVFNFSYDENGYLTSITAPDNTVITYGYTGDYLTSITYPEGEKAEINYSNNKPSVVILKDKDNNPVYKVTYHLYGDYVNEVAEFGFDGDTIINGVKSQFNYYGAASKTTIYSLEPKEDNAALYDHILTTVYTFSDEGDVISEYAYSKDIDSIGVETTGSGIVPHLTENGMSIVSNIDNLISNHSFETNNDWSLGGISNDYDIATRIETNESIAKFGQKLLKLRGGDVAHKTMLLTKGEYTISCYARVISNSANATDGAYIYVSSNSGYQLAQSEKIAKTDSEFVRLIAPFSITAETDVVNIAFLSDGNCVTYIDGVQLEKNGFANDYNMIENGSFESDSGWRISGGAFAQNTDYELVSFNMKRALSLNGNLDGMSLAEQTVSVKKAASTRESFILSGWAKGYAIPHHERVNDKAATFRLRALITYMDDTFDESYCADFSPCTDDWQFASVEFSKAEFKEIKSLKVYCDYDYNIGQAFFDNIQLIRTDIETDLTEDDFISSKDEVDSQSTDIEETENTSKEIEFEEVIDQYGNTLTETTFTDGEFGTIYKAFGFDTETHNNMISETDSRGNTVYYDYNEATSRVGRERRDGHNTIYNYDDEGRTTKISVEKPVSEDSGEIERIDVNYAYDALGNMTEIARGDGMKYNLCYNPFHKLESIGINGKTENLVEYTYKNGSGRLKEITYANGDKMKATYNGLGQMIGEEWTDSQNEVIAKYKYTYDGKGNIVRSIDIVTNKEYNYTYENGQLTRAIEYNITVLNNSIISKTAVCTIQYCYDNNNQPTKKCVTFADGTKRESFFENKEDGFDTVKFNVGDNIVTARSQSDSFGRKIFDEVEFGKGFISRQFRYHSGKATDEHKNNGKLQTSPTTELVSEIVMLNGRTIKYEYDAENRITKVIDSVDGTTEYTYDRLGQLLRETVNGVVKNEMTYDNFGNILTKNGVPYVYGDTAWKDLLTSYNGQAIIYDEQGNPTSYLGHTLTWEKGCQLKSFDGIQYTYNANGIRTSKIVDGVEHNYTLEGSKILREVWDNNTLIPLYDNEDAVCGIIFNNEPFYFQKNLQGDVITIVNKDAQVVAKYSYDAWGVCTVTQDSSECGIATVNPYRYRSYYYDADIQMYYLQSRYYDMFTARYINADDIKALSADNTILSCNIFTYCKNNSITNIDDTGKWLIQLICGVAGAALFGTVANILCRLLGLNSTVRRLVTAGFAILGGCLGAFFGPGLIAKIAPKAVKWVNTLEKAINRKSRFRPMICEGQTVIGYVWDDRFKIMLHFKHVKEPEKGMHICIQVKTKRKWRKLMDDIPLKKIGKVFAQWVKKYLK